jgi:hypothetical protein
MCVLAQLFHPQYCCVVLICPTIGGAIIIGWPTITGCMAHGGSRGGDAADTRGKCIQSL